MTHGLRLYMKRNVDGTLCSGSSQHQAVLSPPFPYFQGYSKLDWGRLSRTLAAKLRSIMALSRHEVSPAAFGKSLRSATPLDTHQRHCWLSSRTQPSSFQFYKSIADSKLTIEWHTHLVLFIMWAHQYHASTNKKRMKAQRLKKLMTDIFISGEAGLKCMRKG